MACQIAFAFLKFLIFMESEATNTTHVRCSDYAPEAYRTNNYATLALDNPKSSSERLYDAHVEPGPPGAATGPGSPSCFVSDSGPVERAALHTPKGGRDAEPAVGSVGAMPPTAETSGA